MAERPQVGTDLSDVGRGAGALVDPNEMLKQQFNPAEYYYDQFKKENNAYLNDQMWVEAAKRGETMNLANLLSQRSALDKREAQQPQIDTKEQTQPEVDEIDWMQKTRDYGKYLDYDTYVLALSLPMYDNTDKTRKERTEPSSGYNYGTYTDRQWAEEILKESFRRYDAIKQKEIQESRNWFQSLGPAFAAGAGKFIGHILEGIEALSDIGESVQNFFGIKVGLIPLIKQIVDGDNLLEKPVNERVLEPFAEDGTLNKWGLALEQEAYKLEYDNLKHIVDPVEAYNQGYNRETGENWGVGYTTWGSMVTGMITSIGDMIPSIILTGGIPAGAISKATLNTIRTSLFYTGVTSRDISASVKKALANGLELKDIDAGTVISNSIIKSAAQWGVEVLLGKLIGFSNVDRLLGMGGESISAIKHIGKTELGALGIAGLNALRDAAKEGLEEVLQDMSDALINYMYGATDGTIGDIYNDEASELSIQSLLESFAVGAMTSIVVSNVQRGIEMTKAKRAGINILENIVDENGKIKKLGIFQTLNYNQAITQIAEWHDVLNDEKSDAKTKADAKMALQATIETLSEFLKTMNVDKALFVNNLLTGMSNSQQVTDEITKLSDTEYGNKLYDSFMKDYMTLKAQTKEAIDKGEKASIFSQVKNSITKLADKLKGNNVTKVDNIVSEETINNLPDNIKTDIETLRKKLGLAALVSHNGSKGLLDIENDIFFLPDNWLQDKDISMIVKQIGYAKVREETRLALDSNQRKMLVDIYNKITKSQNTTIETALDALLFDNKMYTSALMVAAASNAQYKQNAVKLLSTIDQVVKKAALEQQKNNNLTTQAYKTLMSKVYQNMKVGFVNYFTTQERIIDIDSVSLEVIPADIKKEIKASKNIILSEIIDKATNVSPNVKSTPLSKAEKTNMLRTLERYKTYIPQEIYDSAVKQLNSNVWSQQNDAGIMAALASWYINAFDANSTMKVVYVMPSLLNDTNFAPLKADTFKTLNEWLGMPVLEYIANVHRDPYGTLTKLNEEAREFFSQYNLEDAEERYRAIDRILFETSNHMLTFTKDTYEVFQVMNKDEFLKPEYAGENGHDNILTVLQDKSKTHYISDFLNDNVKLNRRFSNVEVILDSSAKTDAFNYNKNTNKAYITLSGHSPLIESLLHEMTHGAQWAAGLNAFLRNTYGTEEEGLRWEYGGGDVNVIKAGLNKKNTESLNKYIQKYFKTSYNYLSSLTQLRNFDFGTAIYFLLDGEIQARTNLDSMFRVFGFTTRFDNVTKSYYLRGPIKENGKYPVWDLSKKGTVKETTQSSQAPRLKRKTVDLEEQRKQKYKDNRAYISNEIAKDSNLKYFIKKGRPILMNKGVRDFIVSTTTDFDKLPSVLRNKILKGTLTRADISDYVATAANMDDYTFKAIAKYVYKNEALAEMTFKDLKNLADRIDQFAAIDKLGELPEEIVIDENESGYDKLMDLYKQVNTLANKDVEGFGKKLQNKLNYVNRIKVDDNYVEMSADPKTLHPMFFNHYDGTLESLTSINNLGKYMAFMLNDDAELRENAATGELEGDGGESSWRKQYKAAIKNYEYKDLNSTLNNISLDDKLLAIENYYTDIAIKKLTRMSDEQKAKYTPAVLKKSLDAKMQAVKEMSDANIDALYMKTIAAEIEPDVKSTEKIYEEMKKAPRSKKNVKDTLRNAATSLTKYISKKSIYNKLSDTTKKYIDWKPTGAKLNLNYQTLSDTELNKVIESFRTDRENIKKSTYEESKADQTTKLLEKQLRDMERKYKEATKKLSKAEFEKLSLKEKLKAQQTKYRYKTKNFNTVSDIKANDTVIQLLNTNWSEKTRMSTVKELTNNVESDVANFKTFFEENSETLLSSDLNSIEDAVKWFIEAIPTMNTIEDYKKYQAVKVMFLSYVLGETKESGLYANMNNNLKSEIENALSKEARLAGTTLSVWQQSIKLVDPLKTMGSQSISLDGIELTPELKEQLFASLKSNDMKLIEKVQNDIIKYVDENKTIGKSFAKRVIAYRSLSMLSSPITWLRNKVSNMIIKPLNKLSSKIGNVLFKGHTVQGQLKLNKQITPDIQNYITKNFIDNGMYDTLVKNISKYNPSDISEKYKDIRGKASKEAIMTSLLLKSMYNQYYNENMFKTKAFNKLYNFLMDRLSDDSYVREASIRYFGKMLAEKGYTLTDEITDDIMNDFASSLGLALADYMHSDNFFNKFETAIKDNEAAWVAYKAILPFASASWNWFKGAMKYTPFGLGRAIVRFGRLEESVRKAETSWNEGKSQIAPELTEYMIRRDLGQGIIGTIGWGFGIMLAALGIIRLNREDYDIPKLQIGDLTIDISSIFGSNSILAGAAMMQGIKDGDLMDGLNKAGKVLLDNMPLMEILEIDMYSSGPADIFVDYLQQSLLSFIPNGIAWLAGATYSGNLKKDTFWKRAAAKIPFLNTALAASGVLDKKVNVYTGSTGSYIDALNRLIPYFSYQIASTNERKTTALGLNKTMLRGQYTINGQPFVVTGTNLQKLNEKYGQWNAEDLTDFYSNKTKVKVKIGNSYKMLTYSQMNDDQRKNAVQTIMSNNAELTKITAWLSKGHKYYASDETYKKLISKGIKKNVYKGTKGFVE